MRLLTLPSGTHECYPPCALATASITIVHAYFRLKWCIFFGKTIQVLPEASIMGVCHFDNIADYGISDIV